MKTFQEFFTEAFDSPARISQVVDTKKKHSAFFVIGQDVYRIDFHKRKNGIVVEFSMNDGSQSTYSLTNKHQPLKVFSTVLQHIRDYVAAHQPKTISFSAYHNYYDDETGELTATTRASLYKKLVNRFSKDLGYAVTTADEQANKGKRGRGLKKRSILFSWLSGNTKETGIHDATRFVLTRQD